MKMQLMIAPDASESELAMFRILLAVNTLGEVVRRPLPLTFTPADCENIIYRAIDLLSAMAKQTQPAPGAGEEEER